MHNLSLAQVSKYFLQTVYMFRLFRLKSVYFSRSNTSYCSTKTWQGNMRKKSFCFFGLRETGVHEELCFAFVSYSALRKIEFVKPCYYKLAKETQYDFLFCFVHFQLFKKPSNSLPTTWQRENRFIVFIWIHVSSLPFA